MKPSRKSAVLAVALALVATGCSQFAPKAGVGVAPVGIDLAFGVDVETMLSSPPPIPTSTLPTLLPPSPTETPTPPPPPDLPDCLPVQAQTTKDGPAPTTMRNQDFERPVNLEGSRPRTGQYFTYFEHNFTGEERHAGFSYKEVGRIREVDVNGGFGFEVQEPPVGHAIDFSWVVVPPAEADQSGQQGGDIGGIYLQKLEVPIKDRATSIEKRLFTAFDPGARLVRFPIAAGNESSDSQAVPENSDTNQTPPVLGTAGNVLTVTSVVGAPDLVFVCDQLAEAWRVGVTIEISGEVSLRIVGNLWIAPQYGGWPIQESITIDGGSDFVSGNFFTRLSRLDPGEVV